MSRVLVYTSPARGHLYPVVPIMQELRRRGHYVAVRTLSSQVRTIRAIGIDAAPLSRRVEQIPLDDYKGRSRPTRALRALETFLARSQHEIADMRSAIDSEQPDAALVDCMTWGAMAVAEASGLPWAEYVPYPIPLVPRAAPPVGLGLPPVRGRAGRLRDRALGALAASTLDRKVREPMNRVRAIAGAGPLTHASDLFALASTVLYFTAEPFEYPRSDWPTCLRMVGPCTWDPPGALPWLDAVEQPLALIATSSERQNDNRLIGTAFKAFADADMLLVGTVPADTFVGIDVPVNARLERFLPHTQLLTKAKVAITHGGAGVTQKALAAGVPVCVVPFGRDQLDVGRRVEAAGAGTYLPAARLCPQRLRAKVEEAIAMRAGARRIAAAFADAGGPSAAVDALESLLAVEPIRTREENRV